MKLLMLIPGILGTGMRNKAGVVWPPTVAEYFKNSVRVEELVGTDVSPTEVIESVCLDVYGRLLRELASFGYNRDGSDRKLIPYPYDWRKDILTLARELDEALTAIVREDPTVEISLICHSMGGLVARACLESATAHRRLWAKAIKLVVFIGTPHLGAPLALGHAMGIAGNYFGISQQGLRKLCDARGYPSAYQLFPAEQFEVIWSIRGTAPLKPSSLFEPSLVSAHGLNTSHLQAARSLHRALNVNRKPAGCRYFSIVSSAHSTVTRFDLDLNLASVVKTRASGDGTVPIWSSAGLPVQTAYVDANHIGLCSHSTTHKLIGTLLGCMRPRPLIAADSMKSEISLSISDRMISAADRVEIVISGVHVESFGSRIVINRYGQSGLKPLLDMPVTASGPTITRVEMMAPHLDTGKYVIELLIDGAVIDQEELLVSAA